MTQEEILEYNKRCAEFLNLHRDKEVVIFNMKAYTYDLLKFHSDWNWIHEVIEAIEKLDFGIKQCRKVVEIYRDSNKENIFYIKKTSRKHSIVEAINQFLIWYNEQRT